MKTEGEKETTPITIGEPIKGKDTWTIMYTVNGGKFKYENVLAISKEKAIKQFDTIIRAYNGLEEGESCKEYEKFEIVSAHKIV